MRSPVTYCTNIHRGESWAEVKASLEIHTLAVKRRLSPDRPFPVGLRLPGLASLEVDAPEAARFGEWLRESGLYVATVNAFPYGVFHGRPVKSGVYLPDWRDPERAAYTLRAARLLAGWLPEGSPEGPGGMAGSVSTVPVGFRADFDPAELPLALAGMRSALEGLHALAQDTGRFIRLSVEPEPGCLVETTRQLVELFERLALPDHLRAHLAACYDCCHQALQFEDPGQSLAILAENSIDIGHVQVSSALHLECGELSCLSGFDEPVYLHQCVARHGDGSLARFDDLGQALAFSASGHGGKPPECWRVHFHVPVFLESLPGCASTQPFLRRFLKLVPAHVPLEVETYTFDVLPPELRALDVVDSIVREIEWVEACRLPAKP